MGNQANTKVSGQLVSPQILPVLVKMRAFSITKIMAIVSTNAMTCRPASVSHHLASVWYKITKVSASIAEMAIRILPIASGVIT